MLVLIAVIPIPNNRTVSHPGVLAELINCAMLSDKPSAVNTSLDATTLFRATQIGFPSTTTLSPGFTWSPIEARFPLIVTLPSSMSLSAPRRDAAGHCHR